MTLWYFRGFVINYPCFWTPNVSLHTFSNCRLYFLYYNEMIPVLCSFYYCYPCTFSSIHLLLLLLLYIQFTLELNIIIQLYIIYQTVPLLLVLLCCDYIKRRKDKKRGREKNLSLATLLLPFLSLHSKMYNWTKMQLLCESYYCTSCYIHQDLKFYFSFTQFFRIIWDIPYILLEKLTIYPSTMF